MRTSSLLLLLLSGVTAAAQVIVGFDSTRGGTYNLQSQAGVRTAISAALPNATFSFTSSLSSDLLANARGLVIMSPINDGGPITALSNIEQAAVSAFVRGGGFAVILTDNNSNSNWLATNTTFVAPFGFSTSGSYNQSSLSLLNPSGNPISNGPFGTVTTLAAVAQGSFSSTPQSFTTLAQLSGGQVVAGYFDSNALADGSGAVLFVADANVFNSGWATEQNYDLLSNFVSFAAVPEPSTVSLMLLGSGAAGLLALRRRRNKR